MAEERSGFRVRGSVQGVGFRWWTQGKAVELGLRGAVMNQGDGSVEVHVAGSPEVIAELERWLEGWSEAHERLEQLRAEFDA